METNTYPLVAINAHLLAGDASYRSAGIAAYIAQLLRYLPSAEATLRYTVFLGQGQLPEGVSLSVQRSAWPTRNPYARILWEQLALPWALRRADVALLHAPAFVGPLLSFCPQVITVHDLSFLRYPALFKRGNRYYLSLFTRLACRRAAAVIAVSAFTAREVTALLGVPPARVYVVHHGVEPRFRPLPEEMAAHFRAEQGLPERFILHLGTLEPRKNLIALVQAFALLPDPEVHLVLAGGKGWFYEDIFAEVARLGLQARVHFPGYVPAEMQELWYNAAHIFAYVSHYEGFGLPVLEALACGVPTLIGDAPALTEVAGDAALVAERTEPAAIAAGLQRLLDAPDLRAALRARGLARAAAFTWEATAQQTAAVYRQVLGRREVSS